MIELTVCPDPECGEVAEIVDAWFALSTDGPALHLLTLCLNNHRYTSTPEE